MLHRCLLGLFAWGLLAGVLLPAPAPAGDLLGWLKGSDCKPPYYQGNPKQVVAAPPGPHRYAEYNAYCPWYGYGFGVPTYNWGYFGAQYRPACVCHKGYYGDLSQWSYRRGY
ncbi:MAG: hypothetical protein A2V70_03280 [Planctomycetes bacterium RBG_13_63_9]|nr:MAG: hypothetical protein A2V70_03280 [Planctomycetes bacterium RBG_13_63_9]